MISVLHQIMFTSTRNNHRHVCPYAMKGKALTNPGVDDKHSESLIRHLMVIHTLHALVSCKKRGTRRSGKEGDACSSPPKLIHFFVTGAGPKEGPEINRHFPLPSLSSLPSPCQATKDSCSSSLSCW